MKNVKKFGTRVFFSLVALVFIFTVSVNAEPLLKIGIVDMAAIAQGFKAYQTQNKELEKDRDSIQKRVSAKEKEVMQKAKLLSKGKKWQSPEKQRDMEREVREMDRDLVQFVDEQNRQLKAKKDDLEFRIQKQIKESIHEVSVEEGLGMVLEKGFLLYSSEELEITDKVVQRINLKYPPSSFKKSSPSGLEGLGIKFNP